MEMYWEGPRYADRDEAGSVLAGKLARYLAADPVLLAIPNGGVAVGVPIARRLGSLLYVIVVRKLQIPEQPEAGFGSVASDGTVLLNEGLVRKFALSSGVIAGQKEKALRSIRDRLALYGERAKLPELEGRTVILVDDGLASGFTMEAAVRVVEKHRAAAVVVAVPTSSMGAYRRLSSLAEEVVCPDVSRLPIFAVADAYRYWRDLDDREVIALMETLEPSSS
ncbi:MAG: phosphoribosyltransferase [Syntrophobacteria bacterium]